MPELTGKTFAGLAKTLEARREQANKHLVRLGGLVDSTKDPEFITFVQEVVDDYMLNVCKLGRIKNQRGTNNE